MADEKNVFKILFENGEPNRNNIFLFCMNIRFLEKADFEKQLTSFLNSPDKLLVTKFKDLVKTRDISPDILGDDEDSSKIAIFNPRERGRAKANLEHLEKQIIKKVVVWVINGQNLSASKPFLNLTQDILNKNDITKVTSSERIPKSDYNPVCVQVIDDTYLYETLLRTVPVHDIYEAIANSDEEPKQKDEFKKQLLIYQLKNLEQSTSWQMNVLVEKELVRVGKPEQSPKKSSEIAAKNVLTGIQYLIMDTKWDIGYFGGETIRDSHTGISNTIPKGMKTILNYIDQANVGTLSWSEAKDRVVRELEKSQKKTESFFSFFSKRGDTTQTFYEKAKNTLQDLRESEQEPNPVDNSSSKKF